MAVNVCCCVKLSPNKKSIFGSSIKNQIFYLVIVASLFAVVSSADTETSCAKVKTFFEKKGVLLDVDIQEQANSGENHALSFTGTDSGLMKINID